jgi:micrococcal nuclease
MVRDTLRMRQALIIILTLSALICIGTPAKVKRIIDGDTFETEAGEKVRLIGINAPEISDIFGQEAKQHLASLIGGRDIELQSDQISSDRDRYNRLLRYVVLNGVDINRQMLLDGYAFAYLKYGFDRETEYKNAQLTASESGVGIWGNNEKEKIVKQHDDQSEGFFRSLSSKAYFIMALVIILILIGFRSYYKR